MQSVVHVGTILQVFKELLDEAMGDEPTERFEMQRDHFCFGVSWYEMPCGILSQGVLTQPPCYLYFYFLNHYFKVKMQDWEEGVKGQYQVWSGSSALCPVWQGVAVNTGSPQGLVISGRRGPGCFTPWSVEQ